MAVSVVRPDRFAGVIVPVVVRVGFVVIRGWRLRLALGLFAVTGVAYANEFGLPFVSAVLIGTLSAVTFLVVLVPWLINKIRGRNPLAKELAFIEAMRARTKP